MCVLVVLLMRGLTEAVQGAYDVSTTIVLANAAVNPVLYYWRLRVLRKAVWKKIMRLFPKVCDET